LQSLNVRLERQNLSYEIRIGSNVRLEAGKAIRQLRKTAQRVALITNQKVFELYGSDVIRTLKDAGFSTPHWLMSDGERFKNFRSLEQAVDFLARNGLERGDVVLALGGGVVGDLAGFAAAVYMRGIALVQMPTTLLAQIDSSVGGKTGINLPVGKNLVGAFHQPDCVLIDTQALTSLASRELVSGFCEALKQSAVASRALFQQTTSFLSTLRSGKKALTSAEMEKLIAAQCKFKASVVRADEKEATNRNDNRSRRILNFGHTTGHALEAVTGYRRFRHGEAVGHGMLVAGEISKSMGLLNSSELESLREGVRLCGPLPNAGDLNQNSIIEALSHDKKRDAGQIKWVLLEGIGHPRIVDGRELSPRLLRAALRKGLEKQRI
jgi:3-dehydroquinate synthase